MAPPELPAWVQQIIPIDMDGAAVVLGISRRFLIDIIKKHPHYERRGAKKVFYPEHIALLREDLSCQGSSSKCATGYTGPKERLKDDAFEKALALATRKKPKKSLPRRS